MPTARVVLILLFALLACALTFPANVVVESVDGTNTCSECEAVISTVQELSNTTTSIQEIELLFSKLCDDLPTGKAKAICQMLFVDHLNMTITFLEDWLPPSVVCQIFEECVKVPLVIPKQFTASALVAHSASSSVYQYQYYVDFENMRFRQDTLVDNGLAAFTEIRTAEAYDYLIWPPASPLANDTTCVAFDLATYIPGTSGFTQGQFLCESYTSGQLPSFLWATALYIGTTDQLPGLEGPSSVQYDHWRICCDGMCSGTDFYWAVPSNSSASAPVAVLSNPGMLSYFTELSPTEFSNDSSLFDPNKVFPEEVTCFEVVAGWNCSRFWYDAMVDADVCGHDGGYSSFVPIPSAPGGWGALWVFGDTVTKVPPTPPNCGPFPTMTNSAFRMTPIGNSTVVYEVDDDTGAQCPDVLAEFEVAYLRNASTGEAIPIFPFLPDEDPHTHNIWGGGSVTYNDKTWFYWTMISHYSDTDQCGLSWMPAGEFVQTTRVMSSTNDSDWLRFPVRGEMLDGDDGYIYFYFINGDSIFASNNVYLTRVAMSNMLNISAYQYWTGELSEDSFDYFEEGETIYDAIADGRTPPVVVDAGYSQISIAWHPFLSKYVLMQNPSAYSSFAMRVSQDLWGPFSPPIPVYDTTGLGLVYVPYQHPELYIDGGQVTFFSYNVMGGLYDPQLAAFGFQPMQ